jgi:hypothetical protein
MTTPVYELDPDEVQVGAANGAGIYLAPAGTLVPDDTSAEWPSPWMILGYLSDDGPTIGSSTDSESLTPWQSRSPIRTVITGRTMTLQFVMWQLNELTLALYFDADVPVPETDGSLKMQVRTDTDQHLYAVGIDTADGGRALRVGFHRANLTAAGDMQLQKGAAVPLDVTLTALDDAGVLADVLLGPATAVAPPDGLSAAQRPAASQTPASSGSSSAKS